MSLNIHEVCQRDPEEEIDFYYDDNQPPVVLTVYELVYVYYVTCAVLEAWQTYTEEEEMTLLKRVVSDVLAKRSEN